MMNKVNIMGTVYTIKYGTYEEFPFLKKCDGYTDTSTHEIIVDNMSFAKDDEDGKKDLETYKKQVLRHEIIHAFLNESGLSNNSKFCESWATNEEMVDWIAIQFPKIAKVFEYLNII